MRTMPNFWDKIQADFYGCTAEEILEGKRKAEEKRLEEERRVTQIQAQCEHEWEKVTKRSYDGSTDSIDFTMLRYCPKCGKSERHYMGYVHC